MTNHETNMEAIRKSHDYYHECYEKKHFIPTWVFYVLGIIGILVGFVVPWAFSLIVLSVYQLAKREGKREGFIDGFSERGDMDTDLIEKGIPVIEHMNDIIRHYREQK